MNARPVTILALIQIFLIVSVFIFVGVSMKLHGYPEPRPWPFLPIFVREHVFYILLVSVIWASITIYSETKPTRLYRVMMIAGAILAAGIAFLGIAAISLALAGPKQPLIMRMQ